MAWHLVTGMYSPLSIDLEKQIEYSLTESRLRLGQRRRMVEFVVPTWETHFQRVEELIERLRVEKR